MTKALLASLADPACFPHRPADVQIVQTHMSIVCLAGELVYKLKKAVTFPFADFSRLVVRRRLCREEVRLNRRLCPDTYLGTAALRREGSGRVAFAALGDDEGPDDLDVAVVMRRLPGQRMLDELVRHRAVSAAEIEALARHVADFHARADRSPEVVRLADPHRLATFAAANFSELQGMPGNGLPGALLAALAAASADDFARLLPVLARRVASGCAIDGHGDLHTRNVCMTEPPAVYDCIEFEPAFRCGDVATENAFLVMDLRYRGVADLARVYVETYAAASGDAGMAALLPTLCAYRAMVRAKVASLAAADPELSAADRAGARHSAWRHLMLAAAYTVEQRGPWWVVVCGPPASGKTRLCRTLADAADWPHLATDAVRKELAGVAVDRPAGPEHYTTAFSQRTYAELLARAGRCTQRGGVVLLDGNFATPDLRQKALDAARTAGARVLVVCVGVDAATAASRAAARQRESGNVSDAGPELAIALRARFVTPTAAEGAPVRVLDGGGGGDLAADVMATLLNGPRVPAADTART